MSEDKRKQRYRRCYSCKEADTCKAMCADVCFDEVLKVEEHKHMDSERDLNCYEIDRGNFISFKSRWASVQRRFWGY